MTEVALPAAPPEPTPPPAPAPDPPPAPPRAGYFPWVFRATEEANRRAFLAALPAGAGGALLDLGTHTGEFTARLAERVGASAVHGVELLPEHAARARARGFQVVEHDLDEGIPFPDGAFDFVTANQVLEHVRRTDRLLAEVRRVLAPGGLACLSTNNLASWHNVVSLALGWQPMPVHVSDEVIVGNPLNPEDGEAHADHGRTHLRLFTRRALLDLAGHHGLAAVGVRTVGYYPLPPALARWATRLDPGHGAFLVVTLRPRAAR